MNAERCGSSGRVQRARCKLLRKTGITRSIVFQPALVSNAGHQERKTSMLRKVAIALLAATMFSAPVLAQGTPGAAPAKPSTPAAAAPASTAVKPTANTPATTKAVATKPSVKSVKRVKNGRHVAHVRHVKRVKHVRHIKRVKPATDARGGMQTSVKPR